MPAYWLMKTEPDAFSFDDLLACPNKTSSWDGVRNYQARNFMRDDFKLGDEVFIYHSRIGEPAIVGVAKVVREAYPDPSALDKKSKYFDKKSEAMGESRWCMVDVQATSAFENPVTLQTCRATKKLADMPLIKPGQRLSIQPVRCSEWETIIELGRPKKI